MPAWRNGLARWTSNPKVVGSTPTVGAIFSPTFERGYFITGLFIIVDFHINLVTSHLLLTKLIEETSKSQILTQSKISESRQLITF